MQVTNILAFIFLISGYYHGAQSVCTLTTDYHFKMRQNCAQPGSTTISYYGNNIKEQYKTRYCGKIAPDTKACMEAAFADCTAEYKSTVSRWGHQYKDRFCTDTGDLKYPEAWDDVQELLSDRGCFPLSLLNEHFQATQDCSGSALPIKELATLPTNFLDAQKTVDDHVKGMLKCVRTVARKLSCADRKVKALMLYYLYAVNIYGSSVVLDDVPPDPNVRPRRGIRTEKTSHGDPHLTSLSMKRPVTCVAPGKRVFLENDYFTIMGNNAPLWGLNRGAVVDQFNITLYSAPGQLIATYTAVPKVLPTTFDSGQTTAGTGDQGADIVRENVHMMKIRHKPAGGVIVIARSGNLKWFSSLYVRMSVTMFEESWGLLIYGCLDNIDIRKRLNRRDTSECATACSSVPAKFQDTCEYDCDVTGDAEFATAAANDVIVSETLGRAEDNALTDDDGNSDDMDTDGTSSGYQITCSTNLALTTILFALTSA